MPTLEARLLAIEAVVCRIEKAVMGNGQPGLMQRLSAVERRVWMIIGGLILIAAAIKAQW
jgi:hypothetical protein